MKIGDEVFVHGYVDEMRKDVVIIRNDGGYFGTDPCEVEVKTDNPQYVNGWLDALNEIMKYSYGMLDAEKFGLQHKIKSMMDTADTSQTEEHQELEAYRKCIKSRSFWDAKHCDGCHFYDDCPFNEREDAPRTYCDTCKHDLWNSPEVCGKCVGSTTIGRKPRMYEPKDEPQTERSE